MAARRHRCERPAAIGSGLADPVVLMLTTNMGETMRSEGRPFVRQHVSRPGKYAVKVIHSEWHVGLCIVQRELHRDEVRVARHLSIKAQPGCGRSLAPLPHQRSRDLFRACSCHLDIYIRKGPEQSQICRSSSEATAGRLPR